MAEEYLKCNKCGHEVGIVSYINEKGRLKRASTRDLFCPECDCDCALWMSESG